MATRRPSASPSDPFEVDRLAQEMFPPLDYQTGEDWADYRARSSGRRREFRAFIESHGWTALALMRAVRYRPAPTTKRADR